MPKYSTHAEFIQKSQATHGDTYDYSSSVYRHCKEELTIVCKSHGPFFQTPSQHYMGRGCPLCKVEKRNILANKKFLERAKKSHGDKYDYSRTNYVSDDDKVEVICHKHGSFFPYPDNHCRLKSGCPACSSILGGMKKSSRARENFEEKSRKHHGQKYDYSKVDYKNSHILVDIICPVHGVFSQEPMSHLAGAGCPRCSESKGEKKIACVLEKLGFKYKREVRFPDCRFVYPLPFDFMIKVKENKGFLLEFQGYHHYKPIKRGRKINTESLAQERLQKIIKRDAIKEIWCNDNGIKLLIIPYWEYKNIEEHIVLFVANNFS